MPVLQREKKHHTAFGRNAVERATKMSDVRFGSKADICTAPAHVRFTPNSDRESGHVANGHVCFTPESGHVRCTSRCLLRAKSGHPTNYSGTPALRRASAYLAKSPGVRG